jgi:hypothetical protein
MRLLSIPLVVVLSWQVFGRIGRHVEAFQVPTAVIRSGSNRPNRDVRSIIPTATTTTTTTSLSSSFTWGGERRGDDGVIINNTDVIIVTVDATTVEETPLKKIDVVRFHQRWDWNYKGRTYQINYRVEGDDGNPPMLLTHGFGANLNHFRYNIPALVDAGYKVYAIDLLIPTSMMN